MLDLEWLFITISNALNSAVGVGSPTTENLNNGTHTSCIKPIQVTDLINSTIHWVCHVGEHLLVKIVTFWVGNEDISTSSVHYTPLCISLSFDSHSDMSILTLPNEVVSSSSSPFIPYYHNNNYWNVDNNLGTSITLGSFTYNTPPTWNERTPSILRMDKVVGSDEEDNESSITSITSKVDLVLLQNSIDSTNGIRELESTFRTVEETKNCQNRADRMMSDDDHEAKLDHQVLGNFNLIHGMDPSVKTESTDQSLLAPYEAMFQAADEELRDAIQL